MAIGFEYYFVAAVAVSFAVVIPRVPRFSKIKITGEMDR
jgi:hypothetical protein